MRTESVIRVLKSKSVVDGAGVRLHRAFANEEAEFMDPFLLLDEIRSDKPEDYIMGFPWHPHRGIETVTYLLQGKLRHRDSLGNNGVITPGDLQWMSAGSGVIHEEMPEQLEGHLHGFQLWVNLPSTLKMSDPQYQGILADSVVHKRQTNGTEIRVISGEFDGVSGPVKDIAGRPEYFDITLPEKTAFERHIPKGIRAFLYVVEGSAQIDGYPNQIDIGDTAILAEDIAFKVTPTGGPLRFLFISGKPLGEPIAWSGPIVMNTREQLYAAFEEYRDGTFVKKGVTR